MLNLYDNNFEYSYIVKKYNLENLYSYEFYNHPNTIKIISTHGEYDDYDENINHINFNTYNECTKLNDNIFMHNRNIRYKKYFMFKNKFRRVIYEQITLFFIYKYFFYLHNNIFNYNFKQIYNMF